MYEDQKGIECWRPARLGDSPRVTQCWRQTIRTRFWVKGSLTTSPRASFHGVPAPTRYLVLLENHQGPPCFHAGPSPAPVIRVAGTFAGIYNGPSMVLGGLCMSSIRAITF